MPEQLSLFSLEVELDPACPLCAQPVTASAVGEWLCRASPRHRFWRVDGRLCLVIHAEHGTFSALGSAPEWMDTERPEPPLPDWLTALIRKAGPLPANDKRNEARIAANV